MDGATAPHGTYLCYGDYILLETPIFDDGTGGLLGLEEIEHSTSRLSVIPTREFTHVEEGRRLRRKAKHAHKDESISVFTKKRYLGISPIYFDEKDNRTTISLPSECFNANIFQIAHSVGFEAPGEPVHYGSQIKLVLVSTQEYLRASNNSDMIEFVSKSTFEHNSSKEYNFKVKPRYNIRGEGELVLFRDLIVLSDYAGREVYTAGSNQIKLTINSSQNSGFRIVQFTSYSIIAEKCLKGGDVLQIYHKVDQCFLNVNMSNIPSSANANNSISNNNVQISALQQDKITIETCSTLWQVETILSQSLPKDWKIQGPLHHGAPFLLRHFLSGKYLSVIHVKADAAELALVDVPSEQSFFEFRLNVHIASPNVNEIFAGNKIPAMSDIRLTHRGTGKSLVVVQENRNVGPKFSLSNLQYDKDVYKIHLTPSSVIEMIVFGKKIMSGIEYLLNMLAAPHLTRVETNGLFAKLTMLLKSLSVEGGFLDANDKIGYTTAIDLGMVQVLFRLVDKAFEKLIQPEKRTSFVALDPLHLQLKSQVWESEKEELAKEAYFILSLLLKNNSDSVFQVIKCGGVSKMIEHLTKLNDVKDRTPPLLELVYSENAESAEINSAVDVMSTHDIEMLLDSVYQQLLCNQVPGSYPYLLLSRLCKADNNLLSSNERVNRKMQMIIAHHLLGSPYENTSWPRYSVFMYRTAISKVENMSTKSERDPSSSSKSNEKFYITTSIFGQIRPRHDPGKPSLRFCIFTCDNDHL